MKYATAEFHATQHIRSLHTSYSKTFPFIGQNILPRVCTFVCVDCVNEICKHSVNFIVEDIKMLEERKKMREEKRKKKVVRSMFIFF